MGVGGALEGVAPLHCSLFLFFSILYSFISSYSCSPRSVNGYARVERFDLAE